MDVVLRAVNLQEHASTLRKMHIDVPTLSQMSDREWEILRNEADISLGHLITLKAHVRQFHGVNPYLDYTGMQLDQYTISKVLGKGHFGTVYLAKVHTTHRVLKVITCNYRRELLTVAEKEARVLAQLPIHNHLLTLADFFQWKGDFCIVMPLCKGGTLMDRLGMVTNADMEVILHACSSALHTLHKHHPVIIHRDIKPDNLFFKNSKMESLVIGDMGLSRLLYSGTYYTSPLGHVQYKAPETVRSHAMPASDMWSLGIVLVCMITQQPRTSKDPKLGLTSATHVRQYLQQLKTTHRDRCCPKLWHVLGRMLKWKHRYRISADQMVETLRPLKLPKINL